METKQERRKGGNQRHQPKEKEGEGTEKQKAQNVPHF